MRASESRDQCRCSSAEASHLDELRRRGFPVFQLSLSLSLCRGARLQGSKQIASHHDARQVAFELARLSLNAVAHVPPGSRRGARTSPRPPEPTHRSRLLFLPEPQTGSSVTRRSSGDASISAAGRALGAARRWQRNGADRENNGDFTADLNVKVKVCVVGSHFRELLV